MNSNYIIGCYGCKNLNGEHCKSSSVCISHEKYEENKEVKTMTKNFKEVIADIKEGEVWESPGVSCGIRIKKDNQGITFYGLKGELVSFISDKWEFTLQRKKVSFTEAFKAYEEGKEIESCYTDYKYKKIDGADNYMNDISLSWHAVSELEFVIGEIRGEWYINA